jgi:hypothetical protein
VDHCADIRAAVGGGRRNLLTSTRSIVSATLEIHSARSSQSRHVSKLEVRTIVGVPRTEYQGRAASVQLAGVVVAVSRCSQLRCRRDLSASSLPGAETPDQSVARGCSRDPRASLGMKT